MSTGEPEEWLLKGNALSPDQNQENGSSQAYQMLYAIELHNKL